LLKPALAALERGRRSVREQLGRTAIAYAERVPLQERGAYARRVRDESFPSFELRPAGERYEYFSLTYVASFEGSNRPLFGYDLYSDWVNRDAMEQARDTGLPRASGKVDLEKIGASWEASEHEGEGLAESRVVFDEQDAIHLTRLPARNRKPSRPRAPGVERQVAAVGLYYATAQVEAEPVRLPAGPASPKLLEDALRVVGVLAVTPIDHLYADAPWGVGGDRPQLDRDAFG
jgi:hypothetical protein